MGKSLGDYNIEKSSSSNIKNIKWTLKNPVDTEKSENKKKTKKISPLNIIYANKTKKVKPPEEKIFKVKDIIHSEKSKKKKTDKRFQNSSASNCKIEQGFTRSGR